MTPLSSQEVTCVPGGRSGYSKWSGACASNGTVYFAPYCQRDVDMMVLDAATYHASFVSTSRPGNFK